MNTRRTRSSTPSVAKENNESVYQKTLPIISKPTFSARAKRSFSQSDQSATLTELDDFKKPLQKPSKIVKTSSFSSITTNQPRVAHETFKDIKEVIAPRKITDLVVHAKKLEEIKGWFQRYEQFKAQRVNPMLLVTGPCGCGKITTVKVIASELGYDVHEYACQTDTEIDAYVREGQEEFTIKESQCDHLIKFIRDVSRFRSLYDNDSDKKIIIVKEIPNVFIDSPQLFDNVFSEFSRSGRCPLIFITTDCKEKDLNFNWTIFNDERLSSYKVDSISMNPISNTGLKKVLKLVTNQMSNSSYDQLFRVPSADVIDSVILSSQGDCRNAIINLLYASQIGQTKLLTEDTATVHSKTKFTAKKFKSIGTDESVTIMHAVGKVFNPKYESVDKVPTLVNNPEYLTDAFTVQSKTFLQLVYANYISRGVEILDMAKIGDQISHSDVFMSQWRDDIMQSYGLNTLIRGAMLNSQRSTSWQSVRGFRNLFSMKKQFTLPPQQTGLNRRDAIIHACDIAPLAKHIKSDARDLFYLKPRSVPMDEPQEGDEVYKFD